MINAVIMGRAENKTFRICFETFTSPPLFMPHKMFVLAHQNCPLGYLIAVPKAVYMLLNHKMRDSRVQYFLVQWVGALLVMLGVGMCGFTLMPTLVAAGIFAPAISFFALIAWLAVGDMFLKFALEDEGFYNLATASHALSVFTDADQLPSPEDLRPQALKQAA
jgi:hypothetical protein